MARLIYATNMSVDGWTEDATGALDWAPPDEEVFVDISGLMAAVRTYLYGRRMYDSMALWETEPSLATSSELTAAFARTWQGADKVVFSSTLEAPRTARTRVERRFDTDVVRAMKASSPHDLLIGGPHLAAQAIDAGLVDELVLYVWPAVIGGQNAALASTGRTDLTLVDVHRFAGGAVRLRYATRA